MSETDDIGELLRRNAERQLAGFDRDGQRRIVMDRLAAGRTRNAGWRIPLRVVAAAVLLPALAYMGIRLLNVTGPGTAGPVGTRAVVESGRSDRLAASTDPGTILLTGSARLLASNDPMLAPHSLWEQ